MPSTNSLSRRTLMQAMAGASIVRSHGPIKPSAAVPDLSVLRHDGVTTRLSEVLKGQGSALQLMFTACE